MIFNVLALGDIVGEEAIDFLSRTLPKLKKEHSVHLTVANGENASGIGILPHQAESIFSGGVDLITLGNHTWSRAQICDYLDDHHEIIRPANYAGKVAGRGVTVWDSPALGIRVGLMNLMGRLHLDSNLDSPFKIGKDLLQETDCHIMLVDFHAEATSEKAALAYYLDGQVSAVWGTHTHVPTADCQILPNGTGFVTDLGMVGPINSILGVPPQQSINLFLGGQPKRFSVATGECKLNACLFSIDTETKACVQVKRVDVLGGKK